MANPDLIRRDALYAAALVAAGENAGRSPSTQPVNTQRIVRMAKDFEKYLQGHYVE